MGRSRKRPTAGGTVHDLQPNSHGVAALVAQELATAPTRIIQGPCTGRLKLVTGEFRQNEAADRYGVDRSTIVRIRRLAKDAVLEMLTNSKPGRPLGSIQN